MWTTGSMQIEGTEVQRRRQTTEVTRTGFHGNCGAAPIGGASETFKFDIN